MSLDFDQLLSLDGLPVADGTDVAAYEPTVLSEVVSHPNNRHVDLESDYSLVRKNLNQQSQMLMAMAVIALENAKNAESPRHVEVFAGLMGQMTATNKELLKIHKDMKDITDEGVKTKQPDVTVNASQLFVGSAAELMMQIGTAQESKDRQEKLLYDSQKETE